jgi:catechol 2,3-dioxygenase-like lactoylglutathione lyase family enzyme
MLTSATLVAFVTVSDAARAKKFYRDALGLKLVSEDGFALLFDAHGTPLRVSIALKVTPAPYTVLGWQVDDVSATVSALTNAGVQFERFPGMEQDALGIWSAPSGTKVAWFKDPDSNLLSVSSQ